MPAAENGYIHGVDEEIRVDEEKEAAKEMVESPHGKVTTAPLEDDAIKMPDDVPPPLRDESHNKVQEAPGFTAPDTLQIHEEHKEHDEGEEDREQLESRYGRRSHRSRRRRQQHHEDSESDESKAIILSVVTLIFVWPWGLYRI